MGRFSLMLKLEKYQKYSRRDVHQIFKVENLFDQIWRMWGIINLGKYRREMDGDFIFFVTIGSSVDGKQWDEGITSNGVVSWQSQNQNSLTSPNILKLINHDEQVNNIYYFYRQDEGALYKYLGKLKYLNHDKERQKPVYFQWQLIDWDIKRNTELNITNEPFVNVEEIENSNELVLQNPPIITKTKGISTEQFRVRKDIDYSAIDRKNKKVGLGGEKLVLLYEKKFLLDNNRQDLAAKVSHVSVDIGDGLGYDILSYEKNGEKKYIEVKTTSGNSKTDFFVTKSELKRSNTEKNYFLYRVYNYDQTNNKGDFFIKKGALDENFMLEPDNYKAKVLKD